MTSDHPERAALVTASSSAATLSYAAYDLIGAVAGLAALPVLPFLLPTRYGRGFGERLGRLPEAVRGLQRPLWVHAASVGEVLAAEPLLQQFRRERPHLPLLMSTTSTTGRDTARARLPVDAAMLLPLDLGGIADRVMRAVRPQALILIETEIWPALIRAAARHRVPTLIVSGRVSTRSAARYARIRWLTRAVLAQVSAFAMQTQADAARLIALGAPAARVQVIGSLKFARDADSSGTAPSAPPPVANGRPLLIAASTHPGEEQLVLDACARLWAEFPHLLLLIAPRRPERFDDVDRLLAQAGVVHERRSQLRGPVGQRTRVLLLDTIGELPNLFPASRAVFVGGTVAPIGGHNVLEPAVFSKPVAFGPHTENVAAAADLLLEHAAATRVRDAHELHAAWRELLCHPEAAAAMGARARAVVSARAAVARRTFELVCQFLGGS